MKYSDVETEDDKESNKIKRLLKHMEPVFKHLLTILFNGRRHWQFLYNSVNLVSLKSIIEFLNGIILKIETNWFYTTKYFIKGYPNLVVPVFFSSYYMLRKTPSTEIRYRNTK